MNKARFLVSVMAAANGTPSAIERGAELAAQARAAGFVRAEGGDTAAMIGRINAAVERMQGEQADRLDRLEAAVRGVEEHSNDQAARAASDLLSGGPGAPAALPIDTAYSGAFASYFRKGATDAEASLKTANAMGERGTIQAAMSVGDNSAGGYLAPVEWDRKIQKAQYAKSPMRRIAQVQTTSVGAYSTLWSNNQWGSGWVGETAARPSTTTPVLSPLVFGHGEIYANPAATQRILDDAAMNVEEWLANELEEAFNVQEGIAFISGDGVNKPFGLLQYVAGGAAATQHPGGVLDVTPSGVADKLGSPDTLLDFSYGLAAPYRQNATWLMNSLTASAVSKMKDGQGNYIWREGLIVGQPATLLGRPVEIDENMPSVGAAVNGVAAVPIAFGDFRAGYLINDRIGTRILRDPYTAKPYVTFYATKRVGAGVLDPRAIRLMKIAVS